MSIYDNIHDSALKIENEKKEEKHALEALNREVTLLSKRKKKRN